MPTTAGVVVMVTGPVVHAQPLAGQSFASVAEERLCELVSSCDGGKFGCLRVWEWRAGMGCPDSRQVQQVLKVG